MTTTAWLFTGQGAQYPLMGAHLFQHEPTFSAVLRTCSELLEPMIGASLINLLYHSEENHPAHPLHQTAMTQPALFAFEYAMAKTLEAHGCEPDYLIGHSVGEIAAATFAGCLSLEDGLKLIAQRGKLMQALPAGGGMAAMMCDRHQAQKLCQSTLEATGHVLDLAGLNGPKQTVVSGPSEGIEALTNLAKASGVKAKALVVSHAFHSHLMEPMLDAFRALAENITYHPARMPLISNLDGSFYTSAPTADYWCQHVRSAVSFMDGMGTLVQHGARTFVEVGPQPILCGLGSRTLKQHPDHAIMRWLSCAASDPAKDQQAFDAVLSALRQA